MASIPTDGSAQNLDDEPLAELRSILLGPDRVAWETLHQRLDNPSLRAQDVAAVLAEAVRLRSDVKMRRALQPLLEEALQLSVQSNPHMLADVLFPIFGKGMRTVITSELEGKHRLVRRWSNTFHGAACSGAGSRGARGGPTPKLSCCAACCIACSRCS